MRNLAVFSLVVAGWLLVVSCSHAQLRQGQFSNQSQQQNQRGNQAAQGGVPARTVIDQPRIPQGYRLTPEQQQWVDRVLGYWEHRSNKVNTFTTEFYRDEYSPTNVKDPKIAWTKAKGVIKYAKPDKAMYRVDEIHNFDVQKGGYVKRESGQFEHWICDGQSTFEFDARNKLVTERPLPQHMRGEAIADGPLPFLFGAEAAKLKQRYWFAPLVPPLDPKTGKPRENEFWLSAKPKTTGDAQNFSEVKVVIDGQDFLPRELHIYMPGGQERKVFYFTKREENPSFEFLRRDFSKPRIPFGWKKKFEDLHSVGRPVQPQGRRRFISQIPVPQLR